jgi:hypothetical protein
LFSNKNYKLKKEYKDSYKLNVEQEESLIGLTLGDVSIEKSKNSLNARIRFEQSVIHEEYLMFLYQLFEPLTNMTPKVQIRKPDSRTEKQYKSIRFATLSMPCINYYHELFYLKENSKWIKKVPLNICDIFTARALAFFIMDDGGKGSSNETILHTRAFKKFEFNLLRKALEVNFDLHSRLIEKYSNQWVIVIPAKENKKLNEIVKPYMHDSMLYKIKI